MIDRLGDKKETLFSLGETKENSMNTLKYMPLRNLIPFTNAAFTEDMMEEMLEQLNKECK